MNICYDSNDDNLYISEISYDGYLAQERFFKFEANQFAANSKLVCDGIRIVKNTVLDLYVLISIESTE